MTKVIILGQEPKEQKELKKIEFEKIIDVKDGKIAEEEIHILHKKPESWDNVLLLKSDFTGSGFDLLFAYDDAQNSGCLYLGHFNDGIV